MNDQIAENKTTANLLVCPIYCEWDDNQVMTSSEVTEELVEMSISDDDEVYKFSTPQKLKYTSEELLALRNSPECVLKPSVLKPEYFDNDGYWNPNLWHSAIGPSDAGYRASGRQGNSAGKSIQHISKRINLEENIPVLSPHRQSFGPGCQVEKSKSVSSVHDKENIRGQDLRRIERGKRRSESGCGDRFNWHDKESSDFPRRQMTRSNSTRSESKGEKKFFTTAAAAASSKSQDGSYVSDLNNNKMKTSVEPRNRTERKDATTNVKGETKKPKTKVSDDDSLDDPPRASVAAVLECQIGARSRHQSFNEVEPEWMSAGDNADLEFDFGNLEDLKAKFNHDADVKENKTKKPEEPTKFDLNTFFHNEQKQQKVAESDNEGSLKQSRFTQLFAKNLVDENRNFVSVPQESATVYDVSEIEAPYTEAAPSSESQDLKAFNDLLSKVKVTSDESNYRIPSPGLDLFGSRETETRPFSPFSNPEGPRINGVFNDVTNNTDHGDDFSEGYVPADDFPNFVPNHLRNRVQESNVPIKQSRLAHLFERSQSPAAAAPNQVHQMGCDNLFQTMHQHQMAANNYSAASLRNNHQPNQYMYPQNQGYPKQMVNEVFERNPRAAPTPPPNLAFNNAMAAAAAYQSSQQNRYFNASSGLPVTQNQLLSQMSNQAFLKQASSKMAMSPGHQSMRQLPLPLVPPVSGASNATRGAPYLPYPLLANAGSAMSNASSRNPPPIHPNVLLRAQALNAARGRAALLNRINSSGGYPQGVPTTSSLPGGLSTQQLLVAKQNILAAAIQQQRAQQAAAAAYHNES